jgi:hypothetical protein
LFLAGLQCLTYGANKYGELGIGCRSDYCTNLQAIKVPVGVQVSNVAAGSNYSAIVTAKEGYVYTFGNGAYYKLGHGDDEDRLEPTRVVELEVGEFRMDGTTSGVLHIACGVWHTVVVAADTYDVYGWGWNKFGNLGANPALYESIHEDKFGQDCGLRSSSVKGMIHKEEIVALPRRITDLDDAHLLGQSFLMPLLMFLLLFYSMLCIFAEKHCFLLLASVVNLHLLHVLQEMIIPTM